MQFELLATVIDMLDCAGVPHMLAGSYASTFHGEPRMTRDIDLVIDPNLESIEQFVALVDRERFYVSDATEALRNRTMFNLIDLASGWKVDLIIRKERPFSRSEFARRRRVDIGGVTVSIATAEDTVLAKLEWARTSESERQIRDVTAIAYAQDLDRSYLDRWAPDLEVEEQLGNVLRSVDAFKQRPDT
jgi:hypothetical protein